MIRNIIRDKWGNIFMEIIKSGILIISILIIRKLAWKHISRRVQYSLWIFAALYMLFGTIAGVQSSYSLESFISRSNEGLTGSLYAEIRNTAALDSGQKAVNRSFLSQESEMMDDHLYPYITEGYDKRSIDVINPHQDDGGLGITGCLLMVFTCMSEYRNQIKWSISGSILCIFVISNTLFIRRCFKKRVLLEKDHETGLNVYTLDNIGSPFLLGKDIYIDSSKTAGTPSFRHMVIHEYCHFKNCDHIWVIVRNMCLIVSWYNPFMWIAYGFMKRDCELACDEAVLEFLGWDEGREYGYTLLSIIQDQDQRKNRMNVSTSMSSDAKKLKERIERITAHGSGKKAVAAMVIVCMLLLTGYMFLNRADEEVSSNANMLSPINSTENSKQAASSIYEAVKEDEIYDPSPDSDNEVPAASADLTYNIYNSVKYYKGYFYYSDQDGLKRFNEALSEPQTLAEGGVRLGNADKDYIYYIRYPAGDITNAGILRLNTQNLIEERLIAWDQETSLRSDNWLCRNVYADDSIMYLEYNDRCEAYEVGADRLLYLLTDKENTIYSYLDACGIPIDTINEMIPGYLNACFRYGKLIKYVPDGAGRNSVNIEVYDTNTGTLSSHIENCEISILATDKGIVYTDESNDIYLRSWDNKTNLLYSAGETNDIKINYGTYDSDYLYGFYEDANHLTLARISWDGSISDVITLDGNMKDAPSLGYSVNNHMQSYWQNGRLIFEPL